MNNLMSATIVVMFVAFVVLPFCGRNNTLAPADRERVQEQAHKVLRIEIEKHEREHLRKIPH